MVESGYFPLVPYSNRLAGGSFDWNGETFEIQPNMKGQAHPIHGFGWLSEWKVHRQTETELYLRYVHKADPGIWPWPLELNHSFKVERGKLKLEIAVRNKASVSVPVGLGFHPYFADMQNLEFKVQAGKIQDLREDKTPASNLVSAFKGLTGEPINARDFLIDNAVTDIKSDPVVYWDNRDFAVKLARSGNLPHLVIYSNFTRNDFCIEPVSHLNNALNLKFADKSYGMDVLRPGELFIAGMAFEIIAAV